MRDRKLYPIGTSVLVNTLKNGQVEVIVNTPSQNPKKETLATEAKNGNNTR